MLAGLYSSAAGMLAYGQVENTVANNLANLRTPGYFAEHVKLAANPNLPAYRSSNHGSTYIGVVGTGVSVAGTHLKTQGGSLKATGRALDVAMQGNGFFAVQNGKGQVSYTRDGAFSVDASGHLVTSSGQFVLGPNGPIILKSQHPVISAQGQVTVQGQVVGQLQMMQFAHPGALQDIGGSYVQTKQSGAPKPYVGNILQGYLNGSNVDQVSTLSRMLSANRAYSFNNSALIEQNHTLGLLISQVE